jgi:hypothetical protein
VVISAEMVKKVRESFESGLTVGKVAAEFPEVTVNELFAILFCSEGLTDEVVAERIGKVSSGMTGQDIIKVMKNA